MERTVLDPASNRMKFNCDDTTERNFTWTQLTNHCSKRHIDNWLITHKSFIREKGENNKNEMY